jgi:hypothetical protein
MQEMRHVLRYPTRRKIKKNYEAFSADYAKKDFA